MAVIPTYVSAGTYVKGTTNSTSCTPGLPGSRVNGNLLIAVAYTQDTNTSFTCTTSGWTRAAAFPSGNGSMAVFWRYVDGAESAPVIAFGATSGQWQGQCFQYTTTKATSPILGSSFATRAANTTVVLAGITTTQLNSLVLTWIGVANTQTIPTPSGYTGRVANAGTSPASSDMLADQYLAAPGTSTAISDTITSSGWGVVSLELLAIPITGRAQSCIIP